MRANDLSLLCFENSVLPAFRSLWPVGRVLPVQQHDVEIRCLRSTAQLVELGLRFNVLVEGSYFAHQLIAVSRQTFEGLAQHCRRRVSFGRFKKAYAVVVGIADQPCELLLSQSGLYC